MSDPIYRSESDEPAPAQLSLVDDRLTAAVALQRVRKGEYLEYTGDYQNAKQLLGAMSRRLVSKGKPGTALEAFRAERRNRQKEHEALSRILVRLDPSYRLSLPRAEDVAQACRWVWGEPKGRETLVALKTLLGILGASQWRREGLAVPGLEGKLRPHYGVFLPTRTEYLELLHELPSQKGKRVFDIGCGTGVLSFLLLQHGAASVVATDLDARSVACAQDNARRFGVEERFEAREADLFPAGKADLVVCNPPWIPEPPKNRVDRAVFDEGSEFLRRFLHELPAHLNLGGEGLLILSDLAVLLGLRPAGWFAEQLQSAGLVIKWQKAKAAKHGKAKDRDDPLHAARSKELTTLYCLSVRPKA